MQVEGLPDSPRAVPRAREPLEFRAAPGGCDVDFFIAYEFKSMMMQMLVGALFDRAFRRYTRGLRGARARHLRRRSGDRVAK